MTKDSETISTPSVHDFDIQRHSPMCGQQRLRTSSGNGADLFNRSTPTASQCKAANNMGDASGPYQLPTVNSYATKTIDKYELKGIVGYGSSAVVYGAFDTLRNTHVAIKMIDMDFFERNQIDELRRETALMALSKHENILPVYGSFVSGSKLCIVTPYLGGGSCLDIMKTAFPDGLDEISIATILKQALEGICYLHKNGHIHRDVKAGNLLVDEDGSVLLGDFGVSSSLMDGGERGLRKTFVGTPCWMAPEVMEQTGYDYKADIWSFGVTAIELATGQAPFAKLPPLKVLLMTLSNDPPTLVRETSKHRYSKVFKDMVDFCLCKEPSNRPSAERLLQHPFFKHARKKDYLIKSILMDLPPLERRPRKRIQRRQASYTSSDEWDFNDDGGVDCNNGSGTLDNQHLCSVSDAINCSADHVNSHKNSKADQPDYVEPREAVDLPTPKRHISFGHVVVRNPPQPSALLSTSQPIYSPVSGEESPIATSSPIVPGIDKRAKKSTNNPSYYPIYGESADTRRLKVSSEPLCMARLSISSDGMHSGCYLTKSASSESAGERRSRFEIHHAQERYPPKSSSSTSSQYSTVMSNEFASTASSPDLLPSSSSVPSSLSSKYYTPDQCDRNSAEVSMTDEPTRKVGRFELTSTALHHDTSLVDSTLATRISFDSHQPFATSLTSPTNTFSIQNSDTKPISITSTHGSCSQHHNHPHQHDAPYSSLSITPPHSSSVSSEAPKQSSAATSTPTYLQPHIKELIKNNEAQKHLIEDIIGTIHTQRSNVSSHLHKPTSPYSSTQDDDLVAIIDSLEKQLYRIGNENKDLKMENKQLKKELELEQMI